MNFCPTFAQYVPFLQKIRTLSPKNKLFSNLITLRKFNFILFWQKIHEVTVLLKENTKQLIRRKFSSESKSIIFPHYSSIQSFFTWNSKEHKGTLIFTYVKMIVAQAQVCFESTKYAVFYFFRNFLEISLKIR